MPAAAQLPPNWVVNCTNTVDQINGGNGPSAWSVTSASRMRIPPSASAPPKVAYDGILESPTTVIEGQYEIWGNEFCYHKASPSTGASTVFNKLVASTGITAKSDGSTTIDLSLMHARVAAVPTGDPDPSLILAGLKLGYSL